ncbi:MAG TPA: hypothetical protein ENJ06_03695 [Phycisphaeraceae bacterium]|nr:hypothetical protein [Phycisphaeraceae bacterium]
MQGNPDPKPKLLRAARDIDPRTLYRAIGADKVAWNIVKKTDKGKTEIGIVPYPAGRETGVVLKSWYCTTGAAVVKAKIGLTQAQRQWRGAMLVNNAGIATSLPMAMWLVKQPGKGQVVVAAFRLLPGEDLMNVLARSELSSKAARAAGRLTAKLCLAGLFNRDHKPSNIILTDEGKMGLIDTVGIRRAKCRCRFTGGKMPGKRLVPRMLASLVTEPLGLGLLPRRTQLLRGLLSFASACGMKKEEVKTAWKQVEILVREHGDATPVDNPLKSG